MAALDFFVPAFHPRKASIEGDIQSLPPLIRAHRNVSPSTSPASSQRSHNSAPAIRLMAEGNGIGLLRAAVKRTAARANRHPGLHEDEIAMVI